MDFREKAVQLLKDNIQNKNLIKHNLAVGALMKNLASWFGVEEEAEKWELAGLVHDLDWERVKEKPEIHTKIAEEILRKENFPEDVIEAVKRHNHLAGNLPPETLMEKALYYTEEITGLIVAATLVLPSKKIADLTQESVMKRFKEKAFARGVNRKLLLEMPDKINLTLEELIFIALKAMQEINKELEL